VLRDAPELGDKPQLSKLLLQWDVLARFKIHQPDEGALELAWSRLIYLNWNGPCELASIL
jgi:hypothetical protein